MWMSVALGWIMMKAHIAHREELAGRSPFHAKALAYFDRLNADERYWR